MPYIIAEPCINVKDKACVEVCPVDCIYEGPEMLYIHPDECIDCGACEPVCPVKAIFTEDETPEQWKHFIELIIAESERSELKAALDRVYDEGGFAFLLYDGAPDPPLETEDAAWAQQFLPRLA